MSVYQHHPNANAGTMTDEERAAWAERVRQMFAAKRGRGEAPVTPSPEESLAELEQDAAAGRDQKFDLRLDAETKLRWGRAAYQAGMTVSELVRLAMDRACESIEQEPAQV